MAPRYFQGRSVTGQVMVSSARTFADVVEKFRVCQSLPITRAAFLALPERERNAAKQVPYFTPACFTDDPSPRDYSHATLCNLIFLDIDPEKVKREGKWVETGRCPAAPFVNDPQSLYTALQGFNFAAHTTASSTPEKPRMRIVVDAEAIPLHLYAKAVATVGMLLGLASVTTESKVAVQPMFLPTLFADSTGDDEPLIAHRTDARAFTVEDIADEVPDEFADPQQASQRASAVCYGSDALFFLRAPVPEITLAIAREALFSVDADCSYHEWLECGMALRHQFSPRLAEEAFALFNDWSAQGNKYSSEKETRAKWDSVRPTAVGRMPVTIRSLLHRAQQSGWDGKKVKDTGFKLAVQWMDEAESVTDLLENGVAKILAVPLLSSIQEGMLVSQLCTTAKKRWLYTVTRADVRKDMDRLKEEMRSMERSKEKVKEPLWAKGVCYVSAADEFYRHRTGERYKEKSFNNSYGVHLLPAEKQLKEMGTAVTAASLSTPAVEPSKYALNHLNIPKLYDYAYDPSQPMEMVFVDRGKKFLNIYIPTYPELDYAHATAAGTLFQKHLGHLIAEPENRAILCDFLASQVQFPGKKIRWAVLLQSVEGAGKTYLAEVMKAVLGIEHVKIIDGSAVKSGFNEWAFGHQLVVMEEIRVQGSSKHEIMNTLKPLITNDDISVNEKFRNNRQTANISNYLMFTNHHDALALTPGDRRYFVVKSPLQSKEQVKALGENYFRVLFNFLGEHPGAMRAYLNDWEISSDFSADGHAPRTKYISELINDSASDLMAAVRSALLEGDHPLVQFDIVSAKVLKDMIQNDAGLRVSDQHLAQVLRDEGMHQVGRHSFGDERHYLWARAGVNGSAVETAGRRLKDGAKHLCMEILF